MKISILKAINADYLFQEQKKSNKFILTSNIDLSRFVANYQSSHFSKKLKRILDNLTINLIIYIIISHLNNLKMLRMHPYFFAK